MVMEKMENKYAIIENNIVTNVTISTKEYADKNGWILLENNAWIGWKYINGQFIAPPQQEYTEENKQTAISLLQETDWAATIDISNPEYSNPYLLNQNEFLDFRSIVRNIAVNPPKDLFSFPEKPVAQWSK